MKEGYKMHRNADAARLQLFCKVVAGYRERIRFYAHEVEVPCVSLSVGRDLDEVEL